MNLSDTEMEELKKFKERRKAFGGNLSVKNVHNVASQFPNMYKRIFNTNSLRSDLLCTNSPNYSDADEIIVKQYEEVLKSLDN